LNLNNTKVFNVSPYIITGATPWPKALHIFTAIQPINSCIITLFLDNTRMDRGRRTKQNFRISVITF